MKRIHVRIGLIIKMFDLIIKILGNEIRDIFRVKFYRNVLFLILYNLITTLHVLFIIFIYIR